MTVEDLSDVGRNETIIVGKVELIPPLSPEEQTLNWTTKQYKNKVILITDDHMREVENPDPGDYEGRIEADLKKTFFVKTSPESFYILEGVIIMDAVNIQNGGVQQAYLPARFKVEIKPGDKAVYIGTLQYTRNEFFAITKINLKDEYEMASKDFLKKFGNKVKLKKMLVKLAK